MLRKFLFKRICKRIKQVKIQGASNIAKAALRAYTIYPNNIAKKILLGLRPTEPMLHHVLELAQTQPKQQILDHFKLAQDQINLHVLNLLKHNSKIFTQIGRAHV